MPQSKNFILNVDDNDGARYVKTRILEQAGFDVIEAATGAEALALVNDRKPDLVLLDVKLPDISGLEVCRIIKGNPTTASIIVLQTSAALIGPSDRIRGLEGGADNYLAAPIEAGELIANVNALLRLRRVQGDLIESEARFRQFAENITDIFWMYDVAKMQTLYVSSAYKVMWGRQPETAEEGILRWLDAVYYEDRDRVRFGFLSLFRGSPYDEEYRVVRPDNSVHWVRDRAFPVNNLEGKFYRVARITSDISERKGAQERTLHLSRHDGLTGLPNRSMFQEELSDATKTAMTHGTQVAVLLIDLDRFKEINDSLGHHAGDTFLICVANRLRQCMRGADLVARLGGDEFAVICNAASREMDTRINQLTEQVMDAVSRPVEIGANEVVGGASVGITIYPTDSADPGLLLRNADMAMYLVKNTGRSGYHFYNESLNKAAERRRAIETGLRRAIDEDELSLHYQPQFDLISGEICGAEVLLRWYQTDIPSLTTEEIIKVADETGLIIPIGEWTLQRACTQAKTWQQVGFGNFRVAVNFSSRQLRHPNFLNMVSEVLTASDLSPEFLEIEVTEQTLMEYNKDNIERLKTLKDRGIYIAVDDFGIGYSSLGYLKNFPVDSLKIDQLFIRSVHTDPQDAAIVAAIVALGHSLEMKVIAEGIEHQAQIDFLRTTGCDYGQGFLFAKPLLPQDMTQAMERGDRTGSQAHWSLFY